MGEYEDLVELGFEGVDRLATRFHHPAPGAVHHSPEWESDRRRGTGGHKHNVSSPSQSPQRKGRARTISPEDRGRQRDINRGARSPKQYSGHPLPPPREQLNGGRYPPPPPSQYPRYVPLAQPKPEEFLPVKQPLPIGARSQQQQYPPNLPPGTASVLHGKDWEDHDNDSMYESYGYTPDGRRVLLRGGEWSRNDWREDDWRASRRRSPKKKGLSRSVFVVRRDVSRHGRMTRAPSPPLRGYEEAWTTIRESPRPSRRASSIPPSRRRQEEGDWDSPPHRGRSKSPKSHRAVAVVLGALAGGIAGRKMKDEPSKVATVVSAVVGGLGAGEMYERAKERQMDDEWGFEEGRRGRRRWDGY